VASAARDDFPAGKGGVLSSQFRPPNLGLSTIGLSLAIFMQVLDSTIANVSLPTIAGNLGVSNNQST
jgi:DHA2 family multidrug resistance protein